MHAKIRLFAFVCLILSSALAFAQSPPTGAKSILPHVLQGGGWSTAFHIYNLCSQPSSFEMNFKNSSGQTEYFHNGEDLYSILYHPAVPGNAMASAYLGNTAVEREGYAELVDDSGGCVKVSTFPVQHEENGDALRYVRVPAQSLSPTGTILPFLHFPGCDTRITLIGAGGNVTVEALSDKGEPLGAAPFQEVWQEIFWLSTAIPATVDQLGTAKISGNVGAIGLEFCGGTMGLFRSSYPIPGADPTSNLPSSEQYVVENFETLHLRNDTFGGHTYAYRLKLRNPSDRTHSYKATLQIRNTRGVVVASAVLPSTPYPNLSIPAGRFRILGGTVGREDGIIFNIESAGGADSDTATATVTIEVVR